VSEPTTDTPKTWIVSSAKSFSSKKVETPEKITDQIPKPVENHKTNQTTDYDLRSALSLIHGGHI